MASVATSAHHHVGIRVASIERAAAVYVDALDGSYLLPPVAIGAPDAHAILGGPPALSLRLCIVGYADGGAVELFELSDAAPPAPAQPVNLPHFGFTVDDVAAALARVEAAGARRLWPEVSRFGAAQVIYVADADGNVFELLDVPLDGIVAVARRLFLQAGAP